MHCLLCTSPRSFSHFSSVPDVHVGAVDSRDAQQLTQQSESPSAKKSIFPCLFISALTAKRC